MVDLSVNLGSKLKLKNPIMPASGVFGYGKEMAEIFDIGQLGAIVTKGTTLLPKAGNKTPRIAESWGGVLNSVGLENPGLRKVIEEELPPLKKYNVPVIINVSGSTQEEYLEVAETISKDPIVAALEINISCPNVKEGGITFGTSPKLIKELTEKIVDISDKPVFVKLTPNVTDIVECAVAAEEGGAYGISLINTLKGMVIDIKTGKPVLHNVIGGLSGPAIKPVAVRMVWEVSQRVKLPIIGMGGITTAEDIIEFMMAGASAVAIGTGALSNPYIYIELIEDIKKVMVKLGINDLNKIVGMGWKRCQ